MKTCDFKKEVIAAYCYGDLSPEKMKEAGDHLTVCKHCLFQVQEFKKTLVLIKQQRLKEIPSGLLDNYTRQIRERLDKEKEVKAGFVSLFRERISDCIENLRPVFSPRFVPVVVTLCIVVFVFAVIRYSRIEPDSLIEQDIAFLEQLGEDVDEILLKDDAASLSEEMDNFDAIIIAQLDQEIEFDEILEDVEILQELGEEEIDEDVDIFKDLEILDEIEMESSIG